MEEILKVKGLDIRHEAKDGLAVAVDKKLLEVPDNVCGIDRVPEGFCLGETGMAWRWASTLKKRVQRELILPVDVAASSKREEGFVQGAGPHVLESVQQLRSVLGGLLVPELVTGHAQDGQRLVFCLQPGHQCIQLQVLVREASESGYINQ